MLLGHGHLCVVTNWVTSAGNKVVLDRDQPGGGTRLSQVPGVQRLPFWARSCTWLPHQTPHLGLPESCLLRFVCDKHRGLVLSTKQEFSFSVPSACAWGFKGR